MGKITTLGGTPTQEQLEKRLTPKQKIFVSNLRYEGATFELVWKGRYVHINVIYRHDDMDPDVRDGDLTFAETQDMGFWG